MPRAKLSMPRFRNESEEADWWASAEGREYVKKKVKARRAVGRRPAGSSLVAELNRRKTTQIALRLAQADLAQARELAERKGIGYQTLLKILVHEGLQREARRP